MRLHVRPQRRRPKNPGKEATKESMSDTRSELTVSLWRGAQQGRYETYKVPWRENQTVLDVVTFVQRHLDPTLSYRFACRVGMCGSCAMTVNGRPRWTCRTHVSSVAKGGRLEGIVADVLGLDGRVDSGRAILAAETKPGLV